MVDYIHLTEREERQHLNQTVGFMEKMDLWVYGENIILLYYVFRLRMLKLSKE